MSISSPLDLSELYTTTTRHLLLRRYTLATTTLSQLLSALPNPPPLISHLETSSTTTSSWSDLGSHSDLITGWDQVDTWTLKSLKLAMTVYVSMFLTAKEGRLEEEQEQDEGNIDNQVGRIVREGSAKGLINHILVICLQHITISSTPAQQPTSLSELDISPLPPSLITTLTLASLKIDTPQSISSARDMLETWLGQIPDEIIHLWSSGKSRHLASSVNTDMSSSQISTSSSSSSNASQPTPPPPPPSSKHTSSGQDHKAAYHSLIELYVLQLLPRMGDWDIAMDWLGNDQSLGSRRKEYLVRKLHAIKTKTTERVTSSNSPVSSTTTTTTTTTTRGVTTTGNRVSSRRASTSSSSSESEMTARPIGAKPIFHGGSGRQGKLKVDVGVGEEGMKTPRLKERFDEFERKENVEEEKTSNHPEISRSTPTPTPPSLPPTKFTGLRARITSFLDSRNRHSTSVVGSQSVGSSAAPRGLMTRLTNMVLGRPIGSFMILLIILLGIRRAIFARQQRHVTTTKSSIGNSTTSLDNLAIQSRIRDRLRRRTDWKAWLEGWIWLMWRKVREMVIMGTKITYV